LKNIFFILLLASSALAAGPKYDHKEAALDDEFRNVYKDIANVTRGDVRISSVTISSAIVTYAVISTMTVSSATIKGRSNSTSPSPGYIGEVLSCSLTRASEQTLTSAVVSNVCSISLTPGHWIVTSTIGYDFDATTSITTLAYGTSATSATLPNANNFMAVGSASGEMRGEFDQAAGVVGNASRVFAPLVTDVRLDSNTTYYLVGICVFTVANVYNYGSLYARRLD